MATKEKSIIDMLNEQPPAEALSTRQGPAGRTFTYLSGAYVTKRANEIFGPAGWSIATETRPDTDGYVATAAVTIDANDFKVQKCGIGYSEGKGETAVKGAATDAMKRAFSLLGPTFGLDLYPTQTTEGARSYSGSAGAPAGESRPMSSKQRGMIDGVWAKLLDKNEDAAIDAVASFEGVVQYYPDPDKAPTLNLTDFDSSKASKLIEALIQAQK